MDQGLMIIFPMLIFFGLDLVIVTETLRNTGNNGLVRKIFSHLTVAAAIQQLCGTIIYFFDYRIIPSSSAVQYVIYSIMLTAMTFVSFQWFMYLRFLLSGKQDTSKINKILFFLPVLLIAVCAVTSPWTHWLLWFDAEVNYHRGTMFFLQLTLAYIYIVFAAVAMVYYRSNEKLDNKWKVFSSFISFVVPEFLGTYIQLKVLHGGYTMIGMSLGVILMYFGLYIEEVHEIQRLKQVDNLNRQLNETIQMLEEDEDIIHASGYGIWKCFINAEGNVYGMTGNETWKKSSERIKRKCLRKNATVISENDW